MGWKTFAETEKGAAGQVQCESHVEGFFFYNEGVIHHEFLCAGQTVNRWYYLELLKRLRENLLCLVLREMSSSEMLKIDVIFL
jgi:hypothetical protein